MLCAGLFMPKNTNQDIKNLGFTQAMYEVIAADDTAFNALIDNILAEQAAELEGRIGTVAYNDGSSPNATYVKLAEKYLTAAEMLQRRINIILGNSQGADQEINTDNERKQRQDYLNKVFGNPDTDPPVTGFIEKIASGSGTDSSSFVCGSLVSSHFGDDDA